MWRETCFEFKTEIRKVWRKNIESQLSIHNESKCNQMNKQTWIRWVSLFAHPQCWCNESYFLLILNSLFIDSLHFPSIFTHRVIQLFFNIMNRIKIINQVWLGLIKVKMMIERIIKALLKSKMFIILNEFTVIIWCLESPVWVCFYW